MNRFEGTKIQEGSLETLCIVHSSWEKNRPTKTSFEELLDRVRASTASSNVARSSPHLQGVMEQLLRQCYADHFYPDLDLDPLGAPWADSESQTFNRKWGQVRRDFIDFLKQQYLQDKDSILQAAMARVQTPLT